MEQNGRKIKDVDLYAPLDDLKTVLRAAPTEDDKQDDEITLAENAVARRKDTISSFVEGIISKKDAANADDDANVEMEDDTNLPQAAVVSRPKKMLLENGKVRIGTSHQERMKIDPKEVATKDPFAEGKKLIQKDNVSEKRKRKKQEHERKCKLAQMCHLRTRREHQALESRTVGIEPYPSTDHHEAIRSYHTDFSSWKYD